MSKKSFKSQASSSRANEYRAQAGSTSIGSFGSSTLGAVPSLLSCVYEPPDLNAISAPNIIVALKNLQKKDATTKFKALEELQSYVASAGTDDGRLEESIVEAWVKLYPRTSIDSARQVRRLAHVVHGQISVLHGKRIAKYLQQVIGSWLAGLYDNDKSVGRAALDAFKQVFPSEEKMRNVWGVYLSSIMQFALDTITKESPSTLSDERTTTPDDSTAKYSRVIGTIICMVTNAIDELSNNNRIREEPLVRLFLHERKVWDFAADQDAFVRRSVYRLAIVAAKNAKDFLDSSLISATMLKKALTIQNAGSAFDYARALTTLTLELPEIWTGLEKVSPKKSARQRLCGFLKKGSQAGPPEYWDQIAALIKHLPLNTFTITSDGNSYENTVTFSILEALHEGLANSDEPRVNQIPAWNAYLNVAAFFISSTTSHAVREDIARHSLVTMLKNYVNPSADEAKWTIPGPNNEDICVRAVHQIFTASLEKLQGLWSQLSLNLIEEIEKQPSKQSEDGSTPEDLICARVVRWYSLQSAIFKRFESPILRKLISQAVISELNTVLRILEERSGESISSAILLKSALRMPQEIFRHEEQVMTAIINFAENQIPYLLLSSSAIHLIEVLTQLTSVIEVSAACKAGILALRKASESAAKSVSLQSFAKSRFLAEENGVDDLKNIIKDYLELALKGNEDCWEVVLATLDNPVAPKGLIDSIFTKITASLATEGEQLPSLYGLDLVLNRKGPAVKALVSFSGGSHLLSRLLLLAESPSDEISIKARDISVAIESEVTNEKGSSYAVNSMIEIINDGLDTDEVQSLSVDSLVQYARRLLDQSNPSERATLSTALLPSSTQWSRAMVLLMTQLPSLSFSHISPLGGAIALINSSDRPNKNGDCFALRVAQYTIKLFRSFCPIVLAPRDQVIIIKNLTLIYQSAAHRSSMPRSNLQMNNANTSQAPGVEDFFADIDYIFAAGEQEELEGESSVMSTVQQQLFDDSCDVSSTSFYSACAFLFLESEYNKWSRKAGLALNAEQVEPRKTSAIFQKLVALKVATDTNLLVKKLNEILAVLIGYEFEEQLDTVLPLLVTLNCIISSKKSELIVKIPKQRVVLFVKHVVSQVHKGDLSKQIINEVLKILNTLIVPIKDVYDSFWEQMIDFIDNTLSSPNKFLDEDNIPLLHAILELFASLKTLQSEESNEDLEDAWKEKEENLLDRLLCLIKQCQEVCDDDSVPRQKANGLLAQLFEDLSHKTSTDLTELYAVVGCESTALQLAAYHILHYQIPNAQGQISLDKALEKDFHAKLPDELLSLIVVAPSPSDSGGADLTIYEPHALSSYLLSWKLIFDHWTNSSDKVKIDYAAAFKGPYLQRLLDFIYQTLIRNRPKPFDASASEVSSFTPNTPEYFHGETYELLVHLYYLSLNHLPSLCRSWWRDTTSRQTAAAVETWSEKHISPVILASELQAISDWAPSQSTPDHPTTDQPMDIKVSSLHSREITASIPLDDQFLQISIRLPASYPLARASVESLHRVAVDEKKWRGWLLATQGIINFTADGGGQPIIEGLLAWKRNVTATLKGQSECAICYSVVGSDRQLPSKRCGTCKNLFHGSCLFKWFKSSNSSSCPLCRNAFNYG